VVLIVAMKKIEIKPSRVIEHCRVKPGRRLRLRKHKTEWTGDKGLRELSHDDLKDGARLHVEQNLSALSRNQELLYANDSHAVLIIFQAMDAAGKDGMVKHVISGLNPQGCQVFSFKRPSDEELDHDFLWRCVRCLPERGRIGIFNRSYYEEVLVVKVHPEFLDAQKLPPGKRGKGFWKDRYEAINHFEKHLVQSGTVILKFFLNISKQEQKKRFLDRLNTPEKYWKFNAADLTEREYWDDYMGVYEDALTATSTDWAPWHVIPADQKWVARALVSTIISDTIKSLKLRPVQVTEARLKQLAVARRKLANE